MLPANILNGNDTALGFGVYALSRDRETEFKAFLLGNGFADSPARANAIWTQAREYYYGDTGTVTARPQKEAVNRFTSERFQSLGLLPFFTSVRAVLNWNESNPDSTFSVRLNSGSLDVQFCFDYIDEGGIIGLSSIVSEGEYSYVWVLENS